MLGTAQLAKFDNSPSGDAADAVLKDAESSFLCAISLEGKQASGEAPDQLKGQELFGGRRVKCLLHQGDLVQSVLWESIGHLGSL